MQTRKYKGLKLVQPGIFAVCAMLLLAVPGANASNGDHGNNANKGNPAATQGKDNKNNNGNPGNHDHVDHRHHSHDNLVGSWLVWVVPRNCATGELIQAGAFEAMFSFHADGTLDAWVQNRMITTTRSPSFGSWKRVQSPRNADQAFSARFIHLRYSPGTGAFLGRQYAQSTIVVDRNGGEFTAEGRNTGFSPDNVPDFEGCSVMTGARIEA